MGAEDYNWLILIVYELRLSKLKVVGAVRKFHYTCGPKVGLTLN